MPLSARPGRSHLSAAAVHRPPHCPEISCACGEAGAAPPMGLAAPPTPSTSSHWTNDYASATPNESRRGSESRRRRRSPPHRGTLEGQVFARDRTRRASD